MAVRIIKEQTYNYTILQHNLATEDGNVNSHDQRIFKYYKRNHGVCHF